MIKTLLNLGANPYIPMSLGVALYLWAFGGVTYAGKPWFGGMWFFYACANGCLLMHTITGK